MNPYSRAPPAQKEPPSAATDEGPEIQVSFNEHERYNSMSYIHSSRVAPNPSIRAFAEQIVSTWPRLTSEQQAAIGSVIGASDAR